MTYTGDFNGGGKSDLVFRHTDGRIAIWLMSGTTFAGGGGINANAQLSAAIAAAPDFTIPATLATSSVAAQLRVVSGMIASRIAPGAKRQIFFVSIGGFDTHDNQLSTQPGLHAQVADALAYFYDNMVSLGLSNNVTAFTASDFGRTLTSNGDGFDHGWGSHHFVVGGAVKGRNFYGTFPIMGLKR